MDTAKLNDWLMVVTNIGVIAGLVLLAYEVAQTNEAMEREARTFRAQQLTNSWAVWSAFTDPIIENEDIADIWIRGSAGESLNEIERYAL